MGLEKRLIGISIVAGMLLFCAAVEAGGFIQQWAVRYDGPGSAWDGPSAMVPDTSGNVYVTGRSYGSGTSTDFATIKYEPNGNRLWVARYNGDANGADGAHAIAVDGSGYVYVTGESYGGVTGNDYITIKYGPDSNEIVWTAGYDGPAHNSDYAVDIAIDSSANLYVTGCSEGAATGNDYATIKHDSNGNILWAARYDGPGSSSDEVTALAVDSLGNVYVTGSSYGAGTSYDYATIKYDPDSNEPLWVARYNGPGNGSDEVTALAVDSLGNVYVTGESDGGQTGDDYATVKYDPNSNVLWVARYNGAGGGWDGAAAVAVDGSDNVYVTGSSYGEGTSYDYATIKYDPDSNEPLWVTRYNNPGNYVDYAYAITADNSGNCYVAGESYDPNRDFDYVTVKYDPNGNAQWAAKYDGEGEYTDDAVSIAADSANVYVTGRSYGDNTSYDYATIKYSQCPQVADLDCDDDVDLADFAAFTQYWGETGCVGCGRADLDTNGHINFNDLKNFSENWLKGK